MKIPQFALNGSYLPTVSTSSSYRNTPGNQSNQSNHGNQSNDNSPSNDNTLNSPVFSPTRGFTDEHNLMVDMAVAKDKTPFLLANKANDNLQRALNRFMVYHDRERKLVNRMFLQEERIYKKRVARCATALPRRKAKTINTILEERDPDEEEDAEGKWAITKKQTLSSPFGKPRPKTAGGAVTRHRIRTELAPPSAEEETVELTYTFNSLFGDVQKHVRVPSVNDVSSSDNLPQSDKEDDDGDPLSGNINFPSRSEEKGEAADCLTPIPDTLLSPSSRSSSTLHPSLRRSASQEAYLQLERKRTSSGSVCADTPDDLLRSGVVPDNSREYVCENVFGNLSLQVQRDSRLNKIQVGIPRDFGSSYDLETPIRAGPRRSSISESAYRQLGRVKHYEINREDSRRLSGCGDSLFSSSNTTLTYSHSTEPGMAVSKAINFLDRLDKYASSRRSKLHKGLVESVSKNND